MNVTICVGYTVNRWILVCTLFSVITGIGLAQSRVEVRESSVALTGQSSGGTLILMRAPRFNLPYVIVTNHAGDPGSLTLARLATELAGCQACPGWYGSNPVLAIDASRMRLREGPSVSEAVLGGFRSEQCGMWILGGTEAGFGIPKPPASVSASYDSSANHIRLEWRNPPGGYEVIVVVGDGRVRAVLAGNMTSYLDDRNDPMLRMLGSTNSTYVILGARNGTPSNGSGIWLRRSVEQESMMNVPFTQGVAPSFRRWPDDSASSLLLCEQGSLPGVEAGAALNSFYGKGFYQIIKGTNTFQGGVWRRFLGLTAGRRYRVGARLNTLESKAGDWEFAFHAAYDASNSSDLTPAQMAGESELPDRSKGSGAGQIARYTTSVSTGGKWIARSSGADGPGKAIGDITLPEGRNSITVWFRLEGRQVTNTVAVGVDSVTLEDLGKP